MDRIIACECRSFPLRLDEYEFRHGAGSIEGIFFSFVRLEGLAVAHDTFENISFCIYPNMAARTITSGNLGK